VRIPYMPFYVGDFISDTLGLTATEVGAYMLLILAYWQNGGPIPNDKEWIRRVLRHPKRFECILTCVSKYFTVTDTHYTHQRIDKELNKARTAYAQRALGARTANAKRGAVRAQPEPEPVVVREDTPCSPPRGTAPRGSRGTRLNSDWLPSERNLDDGQKLGLSPQQLRTSADRFRDYWVGVAGARGVKLDWDATFRNWLRADLERERARAANAGKSAGRPRGIVANAAAILADIQMEQRLHGNNGVGMAGGPGWPNDENLPEPGFAGFDDPRAQDASDRINGADNCIVLGDKISARSR